MAFFKDETVKSKAPVPTIPRCGLCKLYKSCNSPKMKVTGRGKRRILIIGEAPGKTEDEVGKQFVGKSGRFLENALEDVGINMRKDCWLTNTLICHPPNNATPTNEEIDYCFPNLKNTIDELKPEIIIPVGLAAVKGIIKGVFNESAGAMGRWVGWQIPDRARNAWICPIYHPSYVMREKNDAKRGTVVPLLFKRNLKEIAALAGRPWKKVVDLNKKVEVIIGDDKRVGKILKEFWKDGGPISFDYETNMLKPDNHYAKVIGASVCWRGKRTIAFPLVGPKTLRHFELLMAGENPKIAHNLKFEDRWTNRVQRKWVKSPDGGWMQPDPLHFKVKNWAWDTMNQAHVLDNRVGITSLSFQAYAYLGIGTWGDSIGEYLYQSASYEPNKAVQSIEIHKLLQYCGMDSLATYKLAVLQKKLLNLPPL